MFRKGVSDRIGGDAVISRSHPDLVPFKKDGRLSLHEIYQGYRSLDNRLWERKLVGYQSILHADKQQSGSSLPIYYFRTKTRGEALWLIAGVHGEEPAGPVAMSSNASRLNHLARQNIPMIVFPMMNPAGYYRDWRYQDARRGEGTSVTDCEYLLPSLGNPNLARTQDAASEITKVVTSKIVKLLEFYPPELLFDFHEDEDLPGTEQGAFSSGGVKLEHVPIDEDGNYVDTGQVYIYSQGLLGDRDPIAKKVVDMTAENGFQVMMDGLTRFDERIVNGIVNTQDDGSVENLLASDVMIVDGKLIRKNPAKTTIVTETTVAGVALSKRVALFRKILDKMPEFWEVAQSIDRP